MLLNLLINKSEMFHQYYQKNFPQKYISPICVAWIHKLRITYIISIHVKSLKMFSDNLIRGQ